MALVSRLFLIVGLGAVLSCSPALAADETPPDNARPVVEQMLKAYAKAFESGDAEALGALWKKDGEFIDQTGMHVFGRDEIQKQYAEFFQAHPERKAQVEILSAKEHEPGKVIVAELKLRIEPVPAMQAGGTRTTVVLMKVGEQWLIEGVREELETAASYEHLKELDWMVGRWSNRGLQAADKQTDAERFILHATCEWSPNKSFLVRTFVAHRPNVVVQGKEIIGWDPVALQFRSWIFNSTGGYSQGTWKKDGAGWAVELAGVTPDGKATTATSIFTPVDADAFQIESKNRKQGDQPAEDVPPFTMYRLK